MIRFLKNGNWGLRILALILAIVIYQTLKPETARNRTDHDQSIFKYR